MGQSTPTTTMAFGTFAARYREFRAELHPREQLWFDQLLERARRHSNAINRRPHMDFERPVMLAMLMEAMRDQTDLRAQLDATNQLLQETCATLAERGIMRQRLRAMSLEEMGRCGQRRLL